MMAHLYLYLGPPFPSTNKKNVVNVGSPLTKLSVSALESNNNKTSAGFKARQIFISHHFNYCKQDNFHITRLS